jgi:endonuclease YncB( thermonuclease family)
MATFAFLLLIAALVLFVVSTQQWKLYLRGIVWGAGLLLLIVASVLVVKDNHGGLFRAFADFAANIGSPGESVLAKSFAHNGPQIARFVLPLLDLFLIIGAIIGVLALIAFTPGDKLEKFLRPTGIGLIGAIFGGVLALAIVGTGFGEVAQQRVYSTYQSAGNVADGDTLWMGEVAVRLTGIEAPEADQICREGERRLDCGAEAKRHLQRLVDGALVICEAEENRRSEGTYALPLVRCEASRGGGDAIDLSEQMATDGYAVAYGEGRTSYRGEARVALEQQRGIMHACSLRPDIWRAGGRKLADFRDRGRYASADTMGDCPAQGRQPAPQGPSPLAP